MSLIHRTGGAYRQGRAETGALIELPQRLPESAHRTLPELPQAGRHAGDAPPGLRRGEHSGSAQAVAHRPKGRQAVRGEQGAGCSEDVRRLLPLLPLRPSVLKPNLKQVESVSVKVKVKCAI